MKNYFYGWDLKARGYVEVAEENYNNSMWDMKLYIDKMSKLIEEADCGWSSVQFKAMKHKDNESINWFMVLYTGLHDTRWVPIDGNSKGCNFAVLGENLW